MKRISLLLALCFALTCTGCGSSDSTDVSKKDSSWIVMSDGSSTQEESSAKESGTGGSSGTQQNVPAMAADESGSDTGDSSTAEPQDPTQGGKYDPIVVNEGVEKAVAAGKTESADITGWYKFTYSGFGSVYSSEELNKCFERLQEICDNCPVHMSFSYKNIETGAYIGYNQYDSFMTCSTIKAPYVKAILESGIDLAQIIRRDTYWQYDVIGDPNDLVANMDYGTELTAKQLIEYTILRSDNSAYYLLFKTFGYNAFNNLQYSLGSNYYLGQEWIFTYCTSDDMMKNYVDIYNYGKTSDRGRWLIDLLSDTELNIQIGKALGAKYRVAQKYGSEFNESVFNDCAIVYADSPFVLCVFTQQMPETEQACQIFKDLAVVMDDINTLIAG